MNPRLTDMAAAVGALLKDRKETVAIAESSAGGLVSAALLAIPKASVYYRGAGVIYTLVARTELLGAGRDAVAGMRSSSEPYASFLAERVRTKLGATWGIGETGAAGPTGNSHGDAPGHSCIAIAGPISRAITVETGIADREANMWTFASRSLELLEQCLREARR